MSDNSVKLLEKIIAKIDELKRIDSDNYENFNILSIGSYEIYNLFTIIYNRNNTAYRRIQPIVV